VLMLLYVVVCVVDRKDVVVDRVGVLG